MQELDQLISTLASVAASNAPMNRPKDAIDRELAAPARTSNIVSLADSPEIHAFRSELVDGLIRVDTANQFLRLLNQVITQLL